MERSLTQMTNTILVILIKCHNILSNRKYFLNVPHYALLYNRNQLMALFTFIFTFTFSIFVFILARNPCIYTFVLLLFIFYPLSILCFLILLLLLLPHRQNTNIPPHISIPPQSSDSFLFFFFAPSHSFNQKGKTIKLSC